MTLRQLQTRVNQLVTESKNPDQLIAVRVTTHTPTGKSRDKWYPVEFIMGGRIQLTDGNDYTELIVDGDVSI